MPLDDRQTEPLSDAASALLKAEQSRPDPAPQFGEAVWNRLALTVGLEPMAQASPPAPAPATPAAGLLSKVLAGSLIAALGAAAGGGAVYVWMDGRAGRAGPSGAVEPPAPAVVQERAARRSEGAGPVDRALSVREELQPQPVESLPPREGALSVEPGTGAPLPIPGSSPGKQTVPRAAPAGPANEPAAPQEAPWAFTKSISAEEPVLLQRARTALARGEAREALALLDDHQRLFPGGQLIESREALRIEALAAAGESARARALADEYRRRFPHSVFLPVVNRAAAGK